MTFWLGVLIGALSSFAVSFLAMVGWWYLTIGRHSKRTQEQIQQDFQKVRDSVLQGWRN